MNTAATNFLRVPSPEDCGVEARMPSMRGGPRPGTIQVDFTDRRLGKRRIVTFRSEPEALRALADVKERGYLERPNRVGTTFGPYALRWLRLVEPELAPATLRTYGFQIHGHLIPAFGERPLASIHKDDLRELVAAKCAAGMKPSSVRVIVAVARRIFAAALEANLVQVNPAKGIGRRLKIERGESKAMDAAQLGHFLAVARDMGSPYYGLLILMSRTGLRIGEALALQWPDVDLERRELIVRDSKTAAGRGRRVDLAVDVVPILEAVKARLASPLVFHDENLEPLYDFRVRREVKRILKAAKLPARFSPHSLRHSYASLMINAGIPIAYVQRQLGHASIKVTVDTYGSHLPTDNKAAVERLAAIVPLPACSAPEGLSLNRLKTSTSERPSQPDLSAGSILPDTPDSDHDSDHPQPDPGSSEPDCNDPVSGGGLW